MGINASQESTSVGNLFGGFWVLPKRMVRVFGLELSVWVMNLYYWREHLIEQEQIKPDEACYLLQDKIKDNLGISKRKQTAIIKILQKLEVLKVDKRGLPSKNYYSLDIIKLSKMIEIAEELKFYHLLDNGITSAVETTTGNVMLPVQVTSGRLIIMINKYNEKEPGTMPAPLPSEVYQDMVIGNQNFPPLNPTESSENNSPPLQQNNYLIKPTTVIPDNATILDKAQLVKVAAERMEEQCKQKLRRHPCRGDCPSIRSVSRPSIQPMEIVQRVLNHWSEAGLKPLPANNTKTFKQLVDNVQRLLQGTFFGRTTVPPGFNNRPLTEQEIITAINNFALAALNLDYAPANKAWCQKLSLARFLYNPYASWDGGRCQLLHYLNTKPKLLSQTVSLVEDKYPQVSNSLKAFYNNQVLGGIITQFTPADENCFRKAAVALVQFYRVNTQRFAFPLQGGAVELARLLCKALEHNVNGDCSKLTPGWFCSAATLNKRFPAYLVSQAVITGADSEY